MAAHGLSQVPLGGNFKSPRRWANVKHALADVTAAMAGVWLAICGMGSVLLYSEQEPGASLGFGMMAAVLSASVFGTSLLRVRWPRMTTSAASLVSLVVAVTLVWAAIEDPSMIWQEPPTEREQATEVVDFARTLPSIESGWIAAQAPDTMVIIIEDDLDRGQVYWIGWMLCGYAGDLELWGWKVQMAELGALSQPLYECGAR